MPIESILYLVFVLAAFALFAVVLSYAEWATRHANDPVRTPADQATPVHHNVNSIRKAA